MNMLEILSKKRDHEVLSEDEIAYFVKGVTDGSIPDYQISALLMAIVLNGMNKEETVLLTKYMTHSGNCLNLSETFEHTVDKHSTGGVGDKTTLIIAPIVAELGAKVAKMSGRGLGHTGGTIDKLESIPGFKTRISNEDFIKQVKNIGVAVVGQTENLAPADKKLYALRDITATVPSIPLIASSIMSKKLAAGNESILLDVKVGDGAFMKTIEDAKDLARCMVDIGTACGKSVRALLTNMNYPLGCAIGNSLEIKEVIEVLQNRGPDDLRSICITLASHMLAMSLGNSTDYWESEICKILKNGKAYNRFETFISSQGGNLIEFNKKEEAKIRYDVTANTTGFIRKMQAEKIGLAAMELGAGRKVITDTIDFEAGIYLHVKPGSKISNGDVLATLYTNNETKLKHAEEIFLSGIQIADKADNLLPLLLDIVH